jgi:hypothetical protein
MEYKKCLNNMVMIKLDAENTSIKLRNGFELYLDNSFEPEKNVTVTGEVFGLPSHLYYSGEPNKGMPWLTPMELNYGDKVIVYYLSIINAFKPQERRYVLEGNDRYVIIPYDKIYCKYGDGFVLPINGYCLIEPVENPVIEAEKARMKAIGMESVVFKKDSNTHVSYGKVKYVSIPNKSYVDEIYTDNGVDISPGDTVMLKRINDIPLQYDLHARIDGGAKYWRCQRRNILAKL